MLDRPSQSVSANAQRQDRRVDDIVDWMNVAELGFADVGQSPIVEDHHRAQADGRGA